MALDVGCPHVEELRMNLSVFSRTLDNFRASNRGFGLAEDLESLFENVHIQ